MSGLKDINWAEVIKGAKKATLEARAKDSEYLVVGLSKDEIKAFAAASDVPANGVTRAKSEVYVAAAPNTPTLDTASGKGIV